MIKLDRILWAPSMMMMMAQTQLAHWTMGFVGFLLGGLSESIDLPEEEVNRVAVRQTGSSVACIQDMCTHSLTSLHTQSTHQGLGYRRVDELLLLVNKRARALVYAYCAGDMWCVHEPFT